jgi:hypothetical protein
LKLAAARPSEGSLARCRTARVSDARAQGDIDVNTVLDPDTATVMTATGQTKPAAAVRVKLSPDGFAIDHLDQELGQQLMAEALGGRRLRCDAWHPPAIGEGQRERAET